MFAHLIIPIVFAQQPFLHRGAGVGEALLDSGLTLLRHHVLINFLLFLYCLFGMLDVSHIPDIMSLARCCRPFVGACFPVILGAVVEVKFGECFVY